MISAMIVEDDEQFLDRFLDAVWRIAGECGMELQITAARTADELLKDEKVYDIYFFDVELGGISGIDLACRMRGQYIRSEFIFISKDEQAVRASMKAAPRAYLRKDCLESDLKEAFEVLQKLYRKRDASVTLMDNQRCVPVKVEEIAYVQSKEHYVFLYDTNGDRKILRSKLNTVEHQMQDYDFLRVHHRYLVNLDFVEGFHDNKIILKNGQKISLSEKFRQTSGKILQNWISRG